MILKHTFDEDGSVEVDQNTYFQIVYRAEVPGKGIRLIPVQGIAPHDQLMFFTPETREMQLQHARNLMGALQLLTTGTLCITEVAFTTKIERKLVAGDTTAPVK